MLFDLICFSCHIIIESGVLLYPFVCSFCILVLLVCALFNQDLVSFFSFLQSPLLLYSLRSHKSSCFVLTRYNCEAEFRVTANTTASHTVSCENTAGLVDAPALYINTSTDMFLGASAPAANIFSLRHIYSLYDGPLVRLRRSTDNQTANFSAGVDGDLDAAAVAAWCKMGSCSAFVDTWFDQVLCLNLLLEEVASVLCTACD